MRHTRRSRYNLGRTVGFMAHPDDLFYAAGGILAHNVRLRNWVVSVSATTGQAGSQDHARWHPDHLPGIRMREEQAAFARIGVLASDVRFLDFDEGYDFVDGQLSKVDLKTGKDAVLTYLRRIRPQTVITYGPDGLTGHPDHRAVSDWVTLAFAEWLAELAAAGDPLQPRLLWVAVTHDWQQQMSPVLMEATAIYPGAPDVISDRELAIDFRLSPRELVVKLAGIEDHHSQSTPLAEKIGGLHRLYPWFVRETFRVATPVPSLVA